MKAACARARARAHAHADAVHGAHADADAVTGTYAHACDYAHALPHLLHPREALIAVGF